MQGKQEGDSFNDPYLSRYQKKEVIGKGTYGVVYKALDIQTGEMVALKKIINHNENEGIPSTALREVALLMESNHENIVRLRDVVAEEKKLNLIFDYHDQDLKRYLESLKEDEYLESQKVKKVIYQILKGVAYCHSKRIIHRDLKTQNILIDPNGQIKIADFGLARPFSIPNRPYTSEVATLWYRAPEILLGSIEYSTPIDIWSVGIIWIELINKTPLFPGDTDIDQLYRIFRNFGTPNEDIWPGVSQLKNYKKSFPCWKPQKIDKSLYHKEAIGRAGLDLLERMLRYDPTERISAKSALTHPYFKDLNKMESFPSMMNYLD